MAPRTVTKEIKSDKIDIHNIPVKSFITDKKGKTTDIIIGVDDFNDMLALIEDMEDALTYKKIRQSKTSFVPLKDALRSVENNKTKKK